MRLVWAIVAGALGAGAVAWWLAREPAADTPADGAADAAAASTSAPGAPGQVLYRWRDEAGVMQITDIPPSGRDYTIVDVAALERRNTIDANPALEAASEAAR